MTCSFYLGPRVERGTCKTWTLDSGLDRGLDSGLQYGLESEPIRACTVAEIVIKEVLGTDLEVEIHSEQPNITTTWLD